MLLLAACLLAPFSCEPRLQDKTEKTAETPAPSAELVRDTCAALQKAYEPEAGVDLLRETLRKSLACPHPDVIALIDTRGLRSKVREVRGVSVEALGRMPHLDALHALTDALKRDKKTLREEPPEYAALLRAIARHGREESIPLLTEDAFDSVDRGVVTARVLGLGHIRSKKSVAELIQLMRSCPRPRVGELMEEFRLALVVLTGEDKGTVQELWINWYGDHDKGLVITPERAPLPPALEKRWSGYWGEGPRGKGKTPPSGQ